MILFDHIVDMAHGRADEKGQYKRDDVPSPRPDVHVNRIKHREKGETPSDSVDNCLLAGIGELIDDVAEE